MIVKLLKLPADFGSSVFISQCCNLFTNLHCGFFNFLEAIPGIQVLISLDVFINNLGFIFSGVLSLAVSYLELGIFKLLAKVPFLVQIESAVYDWVCFCLGESRLFFSLLESGQLGLLLVSLIQSLCLLSLFCRICAFLNQVLLGGNLLHIAFRRIWIELVSGYFPIVWVWAVCVCYFGFFLLGFRLLSSVVLGFRLLSSAVLGFLQLWSVLGFRLLSFAVCLLVLVLVALLWWVWTIFCVCCTNYSAILQFSVLLSFGWRLFGFYFVVILAVLLIRNTAPRITLRTGFMIFLSSVTGVTGNQVLNYMGLKYSTPTIACALTNLLPAFTFILAVLFRQEYLRIKTKAGVAKVIGTCLSVGGALLLSFYHGHLIGIKESSIHWRYAERMEGSNPSPTGITLFLGPLALIASALVWSVWFIIQPDLSKTYPVPYTSSLYMCFMASICDEHKASAWTLHNHMRLISSLYAAIVCTGLAYSLLSSTIAKKGPLYAYAFTPLLLIITAVISWALLEEKLYVGTAIGSVVIVMGLYSVLWGKTKEMNDNDIIEETVTEVMNDKEKDEMKDMELQLYNPSNGNNIMFLLNVKEGSGNAYETSIGRRFLYFLLYGTVCNIM